MNCWSCEVNQRMSKMVVEMLIKQQKESMHNWLNQPMNHRMGEPMNQRMSESMKQLTNESMNQWINDSMNQCTFSTSFSNSAPTPAVFWDLKCKIELWLQSRANFANLVFQRCSEHTKFWNTNRALATVLCAFCRQLSQLEAHNRGNSDLTLATSRVTLPEKTHGFAPGNVFTRNYLMMGYDAWFTWWCGWHDGVNANHDHRL